MTHSKMLQTRRKKQKIRKTLANAVKREKKLAKQGAKPAAAASSRQPDPTPA